MSPIRRITMLFVFVLFVAAAVGCGRPAAVTEEAGVVSASSMVSTAEPQPTDDEAVSPAQSLGLFAVPAGAIEIPRTEIEAARFGAAMRERASEAPRFLSGVHIALPMVEADDWAQIVAPDGAVSYRLAIHAEGAGSLRAHFTDVPEGFIVLVYGGDPAELALVVRPTRTASTADFWGPIVPGSVLFVEVLSDRNEAAHATIDMVSVGFQFGDEKELGCYLDPTCYSAWIASRDGAAYITFEDGGAQYICSGGLLNDVRSSGTPWFLTAHHCLSTQASADTVEIVWFFQTSTCNGPVPNFYSLPRTYGSDVMCTGAKSDHTLLRLDAAPPAGATYLGWTTADLKKGNAITAIHHPDGAWKRISFGSVANATGNFWKVRYTQSSTEPGSSGCPLFNANKQVVGQLYGGNALCTNMSGTDSYGKFGVSYSQCMKKYLGQ